MRLKCGRITFANKCLKIKLVSFNVPNLYANVFMLLSSRFITVQSFNGNVPNVTVLNIGNYGFKVLVSSNLDILYKMFFKQKVIDHKVKL